MRRWRFLGAAVVLLSVVGCSSDTAGDAQATVATIGDTPQEAVRIFLDAVKRGDEQASAAMLTPLALSETKKYELEVAPPGSATASFEVGEVEMVAEDGAHVASRWTDIDETGQPHSDNIVWMLRKEANGWRIAGMAAVVFPGEPPLYLDFEKAQEMIRKQEMVVQEIERRTNGGAAPAATVDATQPADFQAQTIPSGPAGGAPGVTGPVGAAPSVPGPPGAQGAVPHQAQQPQPDTRPRRQ